MRIAVVALLALATLVVGFLVGWWVGGLGAGLSAVALLALPVLLVGFLVGWLVEWIVDNQYRGLEEARQRQAAPTSGGSSEELSELVDTIQGVLAEREEEVNALRAELGEQESRYDQLQADFDRYAAIHPDDLTAIRGIGRIYQWKLRDAGFATFAQLASASPDHVREMLQIKEWQNVDTASWVDQAKTLMARG